MKKILILVMFVVSQLLSTSFEYLTINKQKFALEKRSYDIYDSKGSYVKFYSVQKDNKLLPVLRLTLNDITGGCSSKTIENGAYEIEGEIITLYTLWNRRGRAYFSPYGAKIQKFRVTSEGRLKEISSYIYVEETQRGYDDDSGMEYLFTRPKTEEEQEKLNAYIEEEEQRYKGKFLFGESSKELIKEVKEALKRKTKAGWKSSFS